MHTVEDPSTDAKYIKIHSIKQGCRNCNQLALRVMAGLIFGALVGLRLWLGLGLRLRLGRVRVKDGV